MSLVFSSPDAISGAQLARFDLGRIIPERCAFDFAEIAHHEPIEICHRTPVQSGVGGAHRRIFADAEEAFNGAVKHAHNAAICRVIAVDSRQQVEAEIVLLRCVLAEPRFEQTDDVLVHVAPVAGSRAVGLDVVFQIDVRVRVRHWQIAGQQIEKRWNIGRALYRSMPAQREDAAARAPDISQQQLDDRCAADRLDACRMLRPRYRITERRRSLASAVRA